MVEEDFDKEILLIDKPKGISSFDVIRILRKELGVRKLGHAGTLDPLATGLLIIGVGKGTKRLNDLLKLPKVYEMDILLGKKTETGDLEGKVLEEKEVEKIASEEARKVLKDLEGEIELSVPRYSAVKVSGEPLYKSARRGVKVTPPKRRMKINSLKLLEVSKVGRGIILKVKMACASGVYARSVGEEIGRRLGFPATLADLRRTRVGRFRVENALQLSPSNL
jgi:tRNA pseudouridine55 synthase